MAGYDEMITIAGSATTLRRVRYAMKKAAVAVMAEVNTTTNHAERVVYAKTVLDGSASVLGYSQAAMTNATLTTKGDISAVPNFGFTDSELEFTVDSMFNAMAGVAT